MGRLTYKITVNDFAGTAEIFVGARAFLDAASRAVRLGGRMGATICRREDGVIVARTTRRIVYTGSSTHSLASHGVGYVEATLLTPEIPREEMRGLELMKFQRSYAN